MINKSIFDIFLEVTWSFMAPLFFTGEDGRYSTVRTAVASLVRGFIETKTTDNTEEKAKAIAAVWGTAFIQIPQTAATTYAFSSVFIRLL